MSRATKGGPGRARRSPLGDKTAECNVTSPLLDLAANKPSFSIYQDGVKDLRRGSLSRPKTCRTSNSFHRLPPVPSASTLQLPSFPDFSFHTITLSASPVPPPIIPPPNFPPLLSQPILFPEESNSENRQTVYEIPAVQHPNSPYVPWALPVRLEILRPLTPSSEISVPSGYYSRPLSRTGAKAPEPIERHAIQLNDKPAKGIHGWKNLRHVVKKNVHHVAKRIVGLKKPFKVNAAHMPTATQPMGSSRTRDHAQYGSLSSYPRLAPRFRSSMTSLDSADTTTLATWLATRQRQNLDRDYDPDRLMTLEDYELKGSWINVSKPRSPFGNACGAPDCEVHSDRRRPSERRSYASLRRNSSLSPLSETSASNSFLPPRLDFTPISPVTNLDSLELLAKIEREMSMPGGWTFGA